MYLYRCIDYLECVRNILEFGALKIIKILDWEIFSTGTAEGQLFLMSKNIVAFLFFITLVTFLYLRKIPSYIQKVKVETFYGQMTKKRYMLDIAIGILKWSLYIPYIIFFLSIFNYYVMKFFDTLFFYTYFEVTDVLKSMFIFAFGIIIGFIFCNSNSFFIKRQNADKFKNLFFLVGLSVLLVMYVFSLKKWYQRGNEEYLIFMQWEAIWFFLITGSYLIYRCVIRAIISWTMKRLKNKVWYRIIRKGHYYES